MSKRSVHTDSAPKALGPYSQAVTAGDWVFCSGQVGIDPSAGRITATDVVGQARQVMKNLEAVLMAAGSSFAHVVKTTIYLASMDDFQAVNAVYGEYFPSDPPARATVEVGRLPVGALVEIDAIARR
jgi:2-iminobutanoate/2-iminopropanoate deaminase